MQGFEAMQVRTRTRKPWTMCEIARLKDYIAQGETVNAAAQKLDRSKASVAQIMHTRGLRSLNRRGINYKWTDEQCERLEALYCAGASVGEMCEALGRTDQAITARLTHMGTCKRSRIQRLAAKARLRAQKEA